MSWLAVAVEAAVCYILGRIRPIRRAADWTEDQLRFETERWNTPFRQTCLFFCFVVTQPVRTFRAWRERRLEE